MRFPVPPEGERESESWSEDRSRRSRQSATAEVRRRSPPPSVEEKGESNLMSFWTCSMVDRRLVVKAMDGVKDDDVAHSGWKDAKARAGERKIRPMKMTAVMD